MSASVTPLELVDATPVPEVVACLETAMALAQSGELRSVAVVGDLTGHLHYRHSGMSDRIALLGHLANATHSVLKAGDE